MHDMSCRPLQQRRRIDVRRVCPGNLRRRSGRKRLHWGVSRRHDDDFNGKLGVDLLRGVRRGVVWARRRRVLLVQPGAVERGDGGSGVLDVRRGNVLQLAALHDGDGDRLHGERPLRAVTQLPFGL